MASAIANVIGFDDGPFERFGPARDVLLVGAVFARTRLDGVLEATTLHGNLPEPLRIAHLIAGGIAAGESRGRA